VPPYDKGNDFPAMDLSDVSLYVNRELSWLAFNERVLDQARDVRWAAARTREISGHPRLEPRRVFHDSRFGSA
jgi:hypothetical protein